jgi:hypothetical protein
MFCKMYCFRAKVQCTLNADRQILCTFELEETGVTFNAVFREISASFYPHSTISKCHKSISQVGCGHSPSVPQEG